MAGVTNDPVPDVVGSRLGGGGDGRVRTHAGGGVHGVRAELVVHLAAHGLARRDELLRPPVVGQLSGLGAFVTVAVPFFAYV